MTTNQKISHCRVVRGCKIQPGMKVSVVNLKRGINAKRTYVTVAEVRTVFRGPSFRIPRIELTFYAFGGKRVKKIVMPDNLYLQQLRTRRPKAGKNG